MVETIQPSPEEKALMDKAKQIDVDAYLGSSTSQDITTEKIAIIGRYWHEDGDKGKYLDRNTILDEEEIPMIGLMRVVNDVTDWLVALACNHGDPDHDPINLTEYTYTHERLKISYEGKEKTGVGREQIKDMLAPKIEVPEEKPPSKLDKLIKP